MKLPNAEIDAIIAASPRTTVPFNKLDIAGLHGTMQNALGSKSLCSACDAGEQ